MIQIAVCDDEPALCRLLNEKLTMLLNPCGEPFSINCFTSSAELLHTSTAYDLIFLDIHMPGFDGMETARILRKRLPDSLLIFITILSDYMQEAFEAEAFDYLRKPIEDARLASAVKRALKRLSRRREPHLLIHTLNHCCSVGFSSIFYCEVINRKLYLHTQEGILEYYGRMEELAARLDRRFFRCHRSYLINLDYFKSYSKGQICLRDGSCIPISRLRHREFMDVMLEYISQYPLGS